MARVCIEVHAVLSSRRLDDRTVNDSIVNKTSVWIKDTMWAFGQVRRRGTPSNIMDVVLEFAPDLQEAIELDAHWTTVSGESTDQTVLAIQESVQVLRTGIATLWKLAMEEGAFFQIRSACAAQPRTYEILYPHCSKRQWINDLFLSESASANLEFKESLIASNPNSDDIGILHIGNSRETRGGYSVYVPENYNASICYPMIVSLHGGSGHGRGQIWMWLKQARSDGVVVLCPTSLDSTWNLGNPEVDTHNILRLIDTVAESWNVDTSRLMLHGISDGGTFALASGLMDGSRFSHLVPCFPSFQPLLIEMSSPSRLKEIRMYLIHGVLDWMFPVEGSRLAYQTLQRAGVDIEYREIEDLSHSYPDEENESILRWYRS